MNRRGRITVAKRENISSSVIRRLPRYYRFLLEFEKQGLTHISSKELAKRMSTTASQVRQDFNCFGEFGQQGIGYSVEQLREEIENILGIKRHYPAVLIGAGNIGTAIANQVMFDSQCFDLVGIFDNDADKIGKKIRDVAIMSTDDIERFCRENTVVTAILCVPRGAVDELAHRIYNMGVRSFWNFSHYDLSMSFPDIIVENVHLSDSLMALCFRINQEQSKTAGF